MEQEYIDREFLKNFGEFYVYGTGIDAEDLINTISDRDQIIAFIDNRRCGNRIYDKPIISIDDYAVSCRRRPVVIATYRYANDIINKFNKIGLNIGIDFFVWDDRHIFIEDDSVKRFIKFNKKLWSEYELSGVDNVIETQNEILIPFDNKHALIRIIPQAYCGNYFAKKYNAKIKGYFRFGATYGNASKTMLKIFKSFNMDGLIKYEISQTQRKEVNRLFSLIWCNLRTWQDWNEIKIYNIHFGTTIIRYLLRHFVPPFEAKDESLKDFLIETIEYVVFWYDYLKDGKVKTVLLGDGVCWDGFIRDIALTFHIPTYTDSDYFARMTLNFCVCQSYPYFKKFWNELSEQEQIYGLKWAEGKLNERLFGGGEYIATHGKDKNVFSIKSSKRILEDNNKIKVLICPSIFEEDCYFCGEQIFDNNRISWLVHIGEISLKTPDYDWYLKMHPSASKRDFIIIENYLKRYPNIKRIDAMVSPIQMKDEGLNYALTVYGTISYEYPLIGIEVINAGANPGMAFNHAWNPRTVDEYDDLLFHLKDLSPKNCQEDLYKCFCIEFLYHKSYLYTGKDVFFDNNPIGMDRLELKKVGKEAGTWMYDRYIENWTKEKHEEIIGEMDRIFQELDEWQPDIFYRNMVMD